MNHRIPKFKSSQEAIAFGRAHATPDIIAALRVRSKRYASLVTKHRIVGQYTIALRYAFKAQLDNEAIEFATHPKRLTPFEQIKKEKDHDNHRQIIIRHHSSR